MGGKFSRTKGHTFERKIATLLRLRFPQFAKDIHRALQSRAAEESDVAGIPGLWLELQHAADPTPDTKLAQAIRDAPSNMIPVAITHKTRSGSTEVSMRMRDLVIMQMMVKPGSIPLDIKTRVMECDTIMHARVQLDLESFLLLVEKSQPWERAG